MISEQERQAAVQHVIGQLCSLKIDGDVFKILAKRRGLPFGANGELLGEKKYQRDSLLKILKDCGLAAEVLKVPAKA